MYLWKGGGVQDWFLLVCIHDKLNLYKLTKVLWHRTQNTHPLYCQCGDTKDGGPAHPQNQPGVGQQEVNDHCDAILSPPAAVLEVHGFLLTG